MRYQLTRPASSKAGVLDDLQHGLLKRMYRNNIIERDKMLKGIGIG